MHPQEHGAVDDDADDLVDGDVDDCDDDHYDEDGRQ